MANIYVRNAAAGAANGTTWANAYVVLTTAVTAATTSDTIWVADDHIETTAGAVTLTCPTSMGLRILCANTHVTEPPTGLAITGNVITTGSNAISINGFAYIYGIVFDHGTGAGSTGMNIATASTSHGIILDTCTININLTGAAQFNFGGAGNTEVLLKFINITFKFGGTGQSLRIRNGRFEFKNLIINAAGSIPTTLFNNVVQASCTCLIESSDLSTRAFTNLFNYSATVSSNIIFRNCKLPASINVVTGTNPSPGAAIIRMENCDSADTNYRMAIHKYEGSILNETTIVRSSGSSDGTTSLTWKMTSLAGTLLYDPLESPEIVMWNESTGSALTATVEIIHDSVTALSDGDVWLELQYLGTSGVPLGTIGIDRVSTVLATTANQTASVKTWTTTGLTNPNTQALAVSFTPQEKGPILGKVMLAKPTYTIYVDPLLVVA